jgi:hypothetical protein
MSHGGSSLHDKPGNKFHIQEFIPEELLTIVKKHGFVAGRDDIYGQRQSRLCSNKFLQTINRAVSAVKSSPMVTPVRDKVPRYFVIIAKKV